MKITRRPLFVSIGLGSVLVSGCGGASSGGGGSSTQFLIEEVSNGFGRLLPYQIAQRDAEGNPTARIIEITSVEDLIENVTAANPIRPPTEWPTDPDGLPAAVLPSSVPGNHFIYARFSQDIDIDSVLDPLVEAEDTNNMTTAIQVAEYDSVNQRVTLLKGRAFVGGKTYGPIRERTAQGVPTGRLVLSTWVTPDQDGDGSFDAPEIIDPFNGFSFGTPGLGFPGTQGGFAGDDVLLSDRTFVFVVDPDEDLAEHETFPAGRQIQMRINEDVLSKSGRRLEHIGFASSTVGPDTIPPEVLGSNTPNQEQVVVIPSKGELDVDPETNIEVQFTEPIQILSVAELDDGQPPALSTAIQIEFGPPAGRVMVPYFVRPFSVYDLSRLELAPVYNLPGSGPELEGVTCGAFGDILLRFVTNQWADLSAVKNAIGFDSSFSTREGTGLVNAPVTPDAIYVGRGGATPGVSVVDLNGFGGGTGNPTFDTLDPIEEGNTNFPNNLNVKVLGSSLTPPLANGQCTFNGGSEGVFTLTKDSSLGDLLARSPLFESVGDMAIGHALDLTFNNGGLFGCQSGGGNICAVTGLKRVRLAAGGANSLAPAAASALPVKTAFGMENLVSWAPHPNPPPIVFPPLCLSPLINAQEPTANVATNLLVPGANSRGSPTIGRPPQNILAALQNSFFLGPSPPQPTPQFCLPYAIRQQIGHFLYVVDRVAAQIVVLNSNRFTVIDRIPTPDPTSLAMSPNMDFLAVTNEGADQVTFIDTDPSSATFHEVVRTVSVGAGPTGIAWESGNEDIFVCNQADGSITIISAFSLRPRKTIRNQLTRPIDIALTPRQLGFGFLRGVYFGYIMNQNGTCAVFESGPDGILGWGFDDTIGSLPFQFFQPKAIQADPQRLNSAVWIVHENPLSVNGAPTGQLGGALSNVGISSGFRGILPFINGPIVNPDFRSLGFGLFASVGQGDFGLSGVPVDLALDNMVNVSAFTNYSSQFSAGQPLSINGKSLVRFNGFNFQQASSPAFLFLAVPNPGVIDVLELSTGTVQRVDTSVFRPGINSIPAPNVTTLADFFRQ
jgi:hypothetical protein